MSRIPDERSQNLPQLDQSEDEELFGRQEPLEGERGSSLALPGSASTVNLPTASSSQTPGSHTYNAAPDEEDDFDSLLRGYAAAFDSPPASGAPPLGEQGASMALPGSSSAVNLAGSRTQLQENPQTMQEGRPTKRRRVTADSSSNAQRPAGPSTASSSTGGMAQAQPPRSYYRPTNEPTPSSSGGMSQAQPTRPYYRPTNEPRPFSAAELEKQQKLGEKRAAKASASSTASSSTGGMSQAEPTRPYYRPANEPRPFSAAELEGQQKLAAKRAAKASASSTASSSTEGMPQAQSRRPYYRPANEPSSSAAEGAQQRRVTQLAAGATTSTAEASGSSAASASISGPANAPASQPAQAPQQHPIFEQYGPAMIYQYTANNMSINDITRTFNSLRTPGQRPLTEGDLENYLRSEGKMG